MQIICFSDSHGEYKAVGEILKKHPRAEAVFFLGDGLSDAEMYASGDSTRAWLAVKGNCDFRNAFLDRPALKIEQITLCGKKLVLTHGDAFSAKSSLYGIMELAHESGADAVLFGHTHTPTLEYRTVGERAVYFFNPGTLRGDYFTPASYGIIEISESGIRFTHYNL